MIAVSQGYEKSISIEVFIKAYLALSRQDQNQIIYFCHKSTVIEHLHKLDISFVEISDRFVFSDGSILQFIDCPSFPTQTSSCLLKAVEFCVNNNAKLLTMPSRKDQFILDNHPMNGHTGYFRQYFKNTNAFMMFYSENFKIALMTEHVALAQVSNDLTKDFIQNKINYILSQYPFKLNNVYVSGINPHNGENGLYGNEDQSIEIVTKYLHKNFQHKIYGPISGDSLANKLKPDDLGIFMFHDQALSFFKFAAGKFGLNITVGLPIERVSVDHGTAEDIYLKNCGDYSSTLYALNFLLKKKPQ